MTRSDRSRALPGVEPLEGRFLLSAPSGRAGRVHPNRVGLHLSLSPKDVIVAQESSTPPKGAITPAEFARAYGIDQLPEQGEGVTIAIVDPLDDPKIAADLATFSTAYGLPQMDGLGGDPTFAKATPQGMPRPGLLTAPEIALDVEWAHAIAPRANILLVESAAETMAALFDGPSSAEAYALKQPGVVVVSNSWAFFEYPGEVNADARFETPAGHAPEAVAFASGDSGQPGFYPAYSPEVIAVGGTTLFTKADGSYLAERGWASSGGGLSRYEPSPGFQAGLGFSNRSIPDVSIDADPLTGVAIFDSYVFPGWVRVGGTSLSCPAWAGLIALGQEARIEAGEAPLDSVEIDRRFYAASNSPTSAADFHDILSGNNGSPAGPGYDQVTGIGSPRSAGIVRLLVS